MANVVDSGGIEGCPSLQSICDLFRALINDSFSAGAGQIATDTAPFMKPLLNSAIRDLYSDLRIIGSLHAIVDNYVLTGLPVASSTAKQTALAYTGYYDGSVWYPNFRLPANLMWVLKLWQRNSGANDYFMPLHAASSGLGADYEVRAGNTIWFSGSQYPTDLRIRYQCIFPDVVGDNIDFTSTYVDIQDSTNAIAYKMVAKYAQRLSPEQFPLAEAEAQKYTNKLRSEAVLASQTKEFQRIPY